MITEQELQQILADGAEKFLDDLRDEHHGSNQCIKNIQNTIKQESSVNSLTSLNLEKIRTLMTDLAKEAFSNVRQQQALSQQRIQSADRCEQLDELCRLYAKNDYSGWDWPEKAEALGLSEDELALQARKRGLHLCLDLDKQWNALHELLTGMTLKERRDQEALSRATSFIEQAKQNPAFPNGCVLDIEEARDVLQSVGKKIYRLRR